MRLSSTSRFNLFIFLILALLAGYAGCGGRDLAGDTKSFFQRLFGPKTPRTVFRKEIVKNGSMGEQDLELWDKAYDIAKSTPLSVETPHRELISLDNNLLYSAQAMRLTVPVGRRLRIRAQDAGTPLFGELFRLAKGAAGKRPIVYWPTDGREIVYEPDQLPAEELLLVVQTPPWQFSRYELEITTEPVLLFPVEGKDESAIQSFWGASRDGGRRSHEGNDIFAPKGTPLLAMTDGEITRVNNGGLGGKTVWLYDAERDLRYYYAHLDEQLVGRGQWVARGDVVGTVGNTGNARTTPPHLHFGVYAGSATDPYPFLRRADPPPPRPQYKLKGPAAEMTVPRSGNHYLRLTPGREGAKIRQLDNGESVIGLGVSERFYRVKTGRGEIGYVNFD